MATGFNEIYLIVKYNYTIAGVDNVPMSNRSLRANISRMFFLKWAHFMVVTSHLTLPVDF